MVTGDDSPDVPDRQLPPNAGSSTALVCARVHMTAAEDEVQSEREEKEAQERLQVEERRMIGKAAKKKAFAAAAAYPGYSLSVFAPPFRLGSSLLTLSVNIINMLMMMCVF